MSLSFDESSSLYVDPPSPTNGEKEESFDKKSSTEHDRLSPSSPPLPTSSVATSFSSHPPGKHKKSSKGLSGLISRAKEGAKKTKAALKHPISNSPLKSPSKSASKSLAKALAKAGGKSKSKIPHSSDEEFDPTLPREKIDEDSEEWRAFQEMQERIKQTVQKTRSNLTKLASTSVADSPDGNVKSVTKPSGGSWVSFEQGEGEKDDRLTEIDIDVIANDQLDLSWATYDDNLADTDLIDTGSDLAHLEVTPIPSPRISPRVPSNSLRTSREDLSQTVINPAGDMDLLGLEDTSDGQASSPVKSADVQLNQDLLGLDFDSDTGDINKSDLFDPLCAPVHAQKPKAVEMLFSSIGDSAQSSQRSSPCVFDTDIFSTIGTTDSPTHQFDTKESSSAQLANTIMDDFLGISESNQPSEPSPVFDPFKTISDDTHINDTHPHQSTGQAPENPFTSNVSDLTAHSVSSINPFSTNDVDMSRNATSEVSESSVSEAPNPWFSQTIEEVTDPTTDIFGLCGEETSVKNNMTNTAPHESLNIFDLEGTKSQDQLTFPTSDDTSNSMVASDMGAPIEPPEAHVITNTQADVNPFPSSSIFDLTNSKSHSQPKHSSAEDDFSTSMAAPVAPEHPFSSIDSFSTTTFAQVSKKKTEKSVTVIKPVQDFDDDFFGKVAPVSDTVDVFDAWGLDSATSKSSNNPFLDMSFSSGPSVETDNQIQIDTNKNPFVSDDFATLSTEKITQNNPFLLESSDSTAPSTDVSAFMFQNEGGSTDNFDPFGVKNLSQPEGSDRGPVSIFEAVSAAGDNQLVEPDEGDDADFAGVPMKLEIRPTARKPAGKAPPIPPPPKAAVMPTRENPFDKESPPEEEFAKFETTEKPPKLESMMSTSTESSTPDDEEMPGPLEVYHPKFEGTGWHLMLRQPTKKKITGNRYWKNVFVKLVMVKDGPVLKLYTDEGERDSFQELPLQPCYSLSDIALQQYDQYGKIHTVKLQYIFYRERVGLRAERITPNFVRKPKPTMILDHSPQVSELLKFGSLKKDYLRTFMWEVEDALMHIEAHRDKTLSYTKDEVSVDVWDEFEAEIDIGGHIVKQKSRVRIFCLAFVTGMPLCELGVNDKRRKGKEVVGRHDIIPVKTEDWIKIQDYEFHNVVDRPSFEKTNTITFRPLDGCQFELMRFRARPKENRELPLQAKVQQIIKGTHIEIRCELLVTGYHANSKKHGQFPCEDIEIHFPIPEKWIYLFRYERRFGYGSVHSTARKPGKIKGLERLTMIAQGNLSPALLEASVGTAKYENVYRAVVWRINRLPERNEGAYKTHLFRLTMDLGPHDELPAEFEQYSDIEFTMPASTVSKTQVRSVSVANPNPPEKWARYVGKYQIKVQIEHIHVEEPTEDEPEQ